MKRELIFQDLTLIYFDLKAPDSIQAASAIASGATGFICNDGAFRRVKEIECLVLDDLLKSR